MFGNEILSPPYDARADRDNSGSATPPPPTTNSPFTFVSTSGQFEVKPTAQQLQLAFAMNNNVGSVEDTTKRGDHSTSQSVVGTVRAHAEHEVHETLLSSFQKRKDNAPHTTTHGRDFTITNSTAGSLRRRGSGSVLRMLGQLTVHVGATVIEQKLEADKAPNRRQPSPSLQLPPGQQHLLQRPAAANDTTALFSSNERREGTAVGAKPGSRQG